MADEQLLYEVSDGVATLTLNRPEQRNALSPQLLGELVDALRGARDDQRVKAVVLTGAGDKVFCAGADLGGFAAEVPLLEKHLANDLFLDYFRLMPRLGMSSRAASGSPCAAIW
jgi:enoyl-CoA hydratase/carnithine racemase